MTQNQKASLRNLTDAELEDKQTATANRSGWREQLAIAAASISGGVFIGWCVAAVLAPAYGIFWMAFVGVTGGMCGCGVMEAAERRFDISKSNDMEDLKQEKKRRALASAPPPATIVAPPGAMTEDFNNDRIRVLKPITLKKPAAAATLTMAG